MAAGKETGLTAHVERWNNTLRQRLGRFVRKSLSFSKSDLMHDICLRLATTVVDFEAVRNSFCMHSQ
jgi:IS1 family transposase